MTGSHTFRPDRIVPRRIYVDVICDLFHYGHARFFEQARSFGTELVVGVCSDEVALSYKRKPILSLEERIESIRACRFVDEILIDPPAPVTIDFLAMNSIDLVVHGDDMSEESLTYWYGAAISTNKFATVSYTPGISTSEIIERVLRQDREPSCD